MPFALAGASLFLGKGGYLRTIMLRVGKVVC